jgi:hypothetical protein
VRDVFDHFGDRASFAATPANVARFEPVEAYVRVVGSLLLRKEDCESFLFRQLRPAGAGVIARRGLRAAVQDDDQRSIPSQYFRKVKPAAERARIGVEAGEFDEMGHVRFLDLSGMLYGHICCAAQSKLRSKL